MYKKKKKKKSVSFSIVHNNWKRFEVLDISNNLSIKKCKRKPKLVYANATTPFVL